MSIPRYRHVDYTDDGCNLYQCLNCYKHIEGRTGPQKFCTWCGIEWEGIHKWMEMDDDCNIITPARMRKERRVFQGDLQTHVELQEMSLIRCDDGTYCPLYDGGGEVWYDKRKWSYVHNTDYFFDHLNHGQEKQWKKWHDLCEKLKDKYGYKYGYTIYLQRLIKHLFDELRNGKDFIFFHNGSDYRACITVNRRYNEIVSERHIDLGGWRQLEDKTYIIREPNTVYEHDDLEASWKDKIKE